MQDALDPSMNFVFKLSLIESDFGNNMILVSKKEKNYRAA